MKVKNDIIWLKMLIAVMRCPNCLKKKGLMKYAIEFIIHKKKNCGAQMELNFKTIK